MEEADIFRRKIARERAARQEAERLLEERALELYNANQALLRLNTNLEDEVRKKTAELAQQHQRYQMLVNSAQDIIFVISREGYFKYVNPIAMKVTGYAEATLKRLHFKEIIRPDHLERVTDFYRHQVAQKTEISYLEFPIQTASGESIWIGQNVSLQSAEGEVMEWTAIARDISDRVISDRKIAELNLRLSTILQNLQEGILVVDENQVIILANQLFCELFQIEETPATLIGKPIIDLAPDVQRHFREPLAFVQREAAILKDRKVITGDLLEFRNGSLIERDFIPIFEGDRYVGHVWRYQDVTQQRQANLKIQQSEEKYRGIIENMRLGLMEVDPDGVIVKPYPRFCEMTGYAPEELIGKKANDVFLTPEFLALMQEQDSNRMEGQGDVYEIKLKLKDGQFKWVMISGAPFYNIEGEVAGSIGIHYDITHQKELQEQLELAREEAERARDAEKGFLANMSHEIRNPINAVVGMTNLLFDTPLNPEQKEYLNTIKYSSDLLLALISDILDISKITAGQLEVNLQTFDLEGLVTAISNATKFRLSSSEVDFKLDYDHRIPSPLLTDTTMVNQILMNLLGNATKFTHQGEVGLRTELIEQNDSAVVVGFEIWDTGIGIAQDQLPHIFDRFNQAGKATASQYGGTGLGLPITKELIELLGGEISVKSEPGQYTRFNFALEFNLSQEQVYARQLPGIPSPNGSEENLSFLIVEDNDMNRLYLERTLSRWGYRFHSTKNGQEALDALDRHKYHMILMDIRMPVMDGYEATIRLRSKSENPNQQVPIIALTASALTDEKAKALKAGMNYHLTKPFSPEQLKEAIREVTSLPEETTPVNEVGFSCPPILNEEELRELYDDDQEHAMMMLEMFAEEMPEQLESLTAYIKAQDQEALGSLLHQIKPHFSMVGRKDLTEMVQQLEDHCRGGKPLEEAPFPGMFEQLLTVSAEITSGINEFVQEKNTP
ncbi:PAS domain-containing sensor histidine kinase [Lewinella sp. W8]|uniref:PAS domain-containing sensor histidine kinase n=1 Tax=Lewinella sp. W8 TaxID=2528208 RepID=UPI001067F881|nr:PAS domain S-box protein [Lewinella sp. W8]MTB52187.1 PAS domain S-box protein [Lewinella sp. W8]